MTLASEDGNRLLKKPYREVLRRWRMCLATQLLLFSVALAAHLGGVSSSAPAPHAVLAMLGPLVSAAGGGATTAGPQDRIARNPWIAPDFLANYSFNILARPNASQCLRSRASACAARPQQNQCLSYLSPGAAREACAATAGGERHSALMSLRLEFCSPFSVARTLGTARLSALQRAKEHECVETLAELQELDGQARRIYCEFDQILNRYDCLQRYSIKWSCADCTEAYKAWVCSMMIPFFEGDRHIKPCRDVCHNMEQKCPYFLPDTKLQYAGEPTFLCIDNDIPETEAVSPNSSYGEPPNCFSPCHLLNGDFHERSPQQQGCHTLTRDIVSANVTPDVVGNATSWPADSSSFSFSFSSSFSSSSSSSPLFRHRGPHLASAVSLYVALVGLFFTRTFSSLPFCLGLT